MKKFFSFLVVMIVVLCCSIVFADMGVPAIKYHQVQVTNPNGAKMWDWTFNDNNEREWYSIGNLNYGDEVTVRYEMEFDGIKYIEVLKEDNGYVRSYYLLKDDIANVPWKLSDFYFSEEEERTVLFQEGVKIYEWPDKDYRVLGTIPYRTTIKGKVDSDMQEWYYISYNGINGWICGFEGALGQKEEENFPVKTLWKALHVYDKTVDGKLVGTIPANTVITDYYSTDPWSWRLYVIYQDVSGYVNSSEVAYSIEEYEWIKNHSPYMINYENAILIGEDNSITVIPKGAELEFDYYQIENNMANAWIHTTYEGKDGWVYMYNSYGNDIFTDGRENNEVRVIQEYLGILSEAIEKNDTKTVDKIPLYEINKERFEEWIREEETKSEENIVENSDSTESNVIEERQEESVEDVPIEEQNHFEEKAFSSQEIILLCVLCAFIASLTTAVIVVLVNKKK